MFKTLCLVVGSTLLLYSCKKKSIAGAETPVDYGEGTGNCRISRIDCNTPQLNRIVTHIIFQYDEHNRLSGVYNTGTSLTYSNATEFAYSGDTIFATHSPSVFGDPNDTIILNSRKQISLLFTSTYVNGIWWDHMRLAFSYNASNELTTIHDLGNQFADIKYTWYNGDLMSDSPQYYTYYPDKLSQFASRRNITNLALYGTPFDITSHLERDYTDMDGLLHHTNYTFDSDGKIIADTVQGTASYNTYTYECH